MPFTFGTAKTVLAAGLLAAAIPAAATNEYAELLRPDDEEPAVIAISADGEIQLTPLEDVAPNTSETQLASTDTVSQIAASKAEETVSADEQELQQSAVQNSSVLYRELTIPYPADDPLIKKYKQEYLSSYGQKWLKEVLEAGTPYRAYIRDQIKKMGLPPELEYLPIVESNYKITAVSKSGATGMWQFMENSMYPFLSKNQWIDERYDPWKSTDAALRKLKDNYRMFQDWPLAIAAYNCGAGALSRALKNAEIKTFWYLSENNLIKNESMNYVPKLLVIADIIINKDWYGIDLPEIDEAQTPDFEEIVLNGSVNLHLLAQKEETGGKAIMFLNPAVLTGITPPGSAYRLRIPAGTRTAIETTLKEQNISIYNDVYTVQKGDTLWGISRRYGITVNDLCMANNLNEKGILSIGRTIVVPIIN